VVPPSGGGPTEGLVKVVMERREVATVIRSASEVFCYNLNKVTKIERGSISRE
jgi:hypothetical protein